MPEFRYNVPSAFFEKLVVGPSFLTADYLMGRLTRGLPPLDGRRIDVHARLGREGVHWYEALRSEALTALMTIPGRHRTGFGVSRRRYLRELEQSRACFSPFGYGEVAWRDYEAVTFGSVLVKNDMSHLETEPDIFVPNETYVPVQWDWTDLREKLESVLNDDTERRRIASNAYRVAADYVLLDGFARQVERLFD